IWAEAAVGCNLLVARGLGRLCIEPLDALRTIGLDGRTSPSAELGPEEMPTLSVAAAPGSRLVAPQPRGGRGLGGRAGIDPGGVVSALCELELLGLAMQGTGRRYQRV